jgi:signal transduction histidine kinase
VGRWQAIDAVIAATVLVVNLVANAQKVPLSVALVLASLLLSGGVALRRWRPEAVAVVGLGGLMVYELSPGFRALPGESAAIVLIYYMVGRRSAQRGRSIVDAVLLVAPVPAIAASPTTAGPGGSLLVGVISVWAFFLLIPFASGRAVESWSLLNRRLRAGKEELERERRRGAERARADERARMAREIHDVVAHSMSVMVVQTAAARRVAAADPVAAARALESVGSCGRDALVDLRRMVGAVHRSDIDRLAGPALGVAGLEKLAVRANSLGLPVEIRVEGQRRPLSPALDLVVFRVVQEALTNTIKYAGPATAKVVLHFARHELRVDIADSGSASPGAGPSSTAGGGHGLIGMRERVSIFGGRLVAGEREGGGYLVEAVIPLDGSVTR